MITPSASDRPSRSCGTSVEQAAELRAEEEEDQRVQQEHDELPHGARLQPRRRADGGRESLLEIHAARDAREHRGHVQRLGGDPRDVRAGEREQRFGERILREAERAHDQPRDEQPDQASRCRRR